MVKDALLAEAHDESKLLEHLTCAEDADALRGQLRDRGLVAFVADGAVLPRRSGVDDRPMSGGAVPFEAPE
ncbi:ABC-ATPase domain-containing protein, partial [Planococcus sp. SIMBA_160]